MPNETSPAGGPGGVTDRERREVERANGSSRPPVVFVHGLWLLPNSWERWVEHAERAGYVALTPGWPGDPATTAEGKAHPEAFAGKRVAEIAGHLEAVVTLLDRRPAVIGHSFGGLLAEILAGRGVAAASVAISPAPFRGVLPLPIPALRSAWPVLHNPRNRRRGVPLTSEQFRYGFANMVGEDEAKDLYERFSVPGSGAPIFQAAMANLNPWTEVKVDTRNPARGPTLLVAGENDHTVPWSIVNASFKRQRRNGAVTEIAKVAGRGHSLTIDEGWEQVADVALAFVKRFVEPAPDQPLS